MTSEAAALLLKARDNSAWRWFLQANREQSLKLLEIKSIRSVHKEQRAVEFLGHSW